MIIEDMSLFEFEETRKEYLNKGTVLTDIDEKSIIKVFMYLRLKTFSKYLLI